MKKQEIKPGAKQSKIDKEFTALSEKIRQEYSHNLKELSNLKDTDPDYQAKFKAIVDRRKETDKLLKRQRQILKEL